MIYTQCKQKKIKLITHVPCTVKQLEFGSAGKPVTINHYGTYYIADVALYTLAE